MNKKHPIKTHPQHLYLKKKKKRNVIVLHLERNDHKKKIKKRKYF